CPPRLVETHGERTPLGAAYTRACGAPQAPLGEFLPSPVCAGSTAHHHGRRTLAAMQDEEVLAEFRASKALLEGHFLLSSGRHSAHYLQCARVLMDPDRASRLAMALASKLPRELRKEITKVVSPAMGGVII